LQDNDITSINTFKEYIAFSHILSMFILGIFLITILYSYNINQIYLPYIILSITSGVLYFSLNRTKKDSSISFDKYINILIYLNAINIIVYFYYNKISYIELLYLLPIIIYSTEYGKKLGLQIAVYSSISLTVINNIQNYNFDLNIVLIVMFLWLAWLIGGVVDIERQAQSKLTKMSEQLLKFNKELKENQELLRINFEESKIGIIFNDTDGNIIKVNSSIADMLGYTIKELLNKNINDIIYEKDFNKNKKYRKQLLNSSLKTINFQNRYMHKNGNIIWVNINSFLACDNKGNLLYILSHVENITEKKNAELKILEQEKEIEHQKLRTKFFANLSHELRTPLNLIFSALQIIKLKHKNKTNLKNIDRYLNIITLNSNRLLRLVNNIIDITKIDSDSFKVKLENHDIVSIIKNITLSTKEYVKGKHREIYFNTSIKSIIIACDPFSLERILLNLISNAVKFTKEDDLIFINLFKEKGNIIIEVADTGIGIKPEYFDRIFEHFRQVDESFSRKNEGSGIGLSLVRSLVELHGGNVKLESVYNEGSSFKIYLPIRQISRPVNSEKYDNDLMDKISLEFSDIYDDIM